MNRKKKEKPVLREEGNKYVPDLFVKVQSTKLEMEESKRSEFHSIAANQLFDGRRSERGRQVQAN